MSLPPPNAEMEIGDLVFVAGPSTVGKSSFISQLQSGHLPREIRARLPPAAETWTIGAPRRFLPRSRRRRAVREKRRIFVPGLIFHYDTTRLLSLGLEDFGEDRGLDILKSARRVLLVDLRAPGNVLERHAIRRIARRRRLVALQRLLGLLTFGLLRSDDGPGGRSRRATANALQAYREPGWLDRLYAKWDAFLVEVLRTGIDGEIILVEPIARRYAPPTFRLRRDKQRQSDEGA